MKISVCVALIIVAMTMPASAEMPKRTYCGRVLAEALALLCYTEDVEKRSSGNGIDYQGDGWQWSKMHVGQMLGAARGKRWGVASECCDQPCSIDVLLSYC